MNIKPIQKSKLGRRENEVKTMRISKRVDPRIYDDLIKYIDEKTKQFKQSKTPIE